MVFRRMFEFVDISLLLLGIASLKVFATVQHSSMNLALNLTSLLNGHYSNLDQYENDLANNVTEPDKHFWLQLRYIQAEVPVLDPATSDLLALTVYYEQHVNNASEPSRQQVLAFTQLSSTLVRMTSYNIDNATRFSSAPSGLAALNDLDLSELSNRPECDALWEQRETDFFISTLATPDNCTFTFFGNTVRPDGIRNLSCSGITFTEVFKSVATGQVLSGTYAPYNLLRTGQTCNQDAIETTPPVSLAPPLKEHSVLHLALTQVMTILWAVGLTSCSLW